jgi:predicted HTH domain antitoxin
LVLTKETLAASEAKSKLQLSMLQEQLDSITSAAQLSQLQSKLDIADASLK